MGFFAPLVRLPRGTVSAEGFFSHLHPSKFAMTGGARALVAWELAPLLAGCPGVSQLSEHENMRICSCISKSRFRFLCVGAGSGRGPHGKVLKKFSRFLGIL